MTPEKMVLEVDVRSVVGTPEARNLRRQGKIPAVVYREGEKALSIEVSERSFSRATHTRARGNILITLRFKEESKPLLRGHPGLAGGEGIVLIKELQHHPITQQVIHIDFHQVSLTKKITVSVPLAFSGEAPGVKQQGGILEHLRWDLEVECLPTEIPAHVPVDVSTLGLGQTLHVRDLAMPSGVRAVTDPQHPVIACVEPKVEVAPAAAAEGAQAVEPEVIKQKKPEEETAGSASEETKEKGKEKPEQKKPAEAKKG